VLSKVSRRLFVVYVGHGTIQQVGDLIVDPAP
jgi:hypothetical protein